jgi:hypothetical protein
MSKFHITITQWGLVSGVRQAQSDMIVVCAPRSPFSIEARKGQLVVVVEAEGDVARGRQACELVATTISETFYADGSTSITSSLRQAIKAANNALYQYNFSAPAHKRALVGATCAVVHGSDLYLTQVPPAQAFLSHTTQLRALPLPLAWTNGANPAAAHRQGALGTSLGSEPEFSRAVLQPGDIVVLCASNIVRLLSRHQAEQLICYSDGPTIAEEFYKLCRSANLPESHAVVLEAVAGDAPDEREQVLAPAVIADRSKHVVGRFSGLFGRGSRKRESVPQSASVHNDVDVDTVPPAAVASVAAQPATGVAAATRPLTFLETLPVADDVPLPMSAFIGEGEYGGQIRPPAVPKRNRQIDLGDNHGTPVDFAAIPRKTPPPPPSLGDRLTFPLRSAFVALLSGAANVPRRTARPAERLPAQGLRLRDLSYRKQRPRLPWINILLILGVIAALVYLGLQKNFERDNNTVDVALNKVRSAVQAARQADDPNQAQIELAKAEVALNQDVTELVQTGLITTTKPLVWSRYLDVRNTYDRAMASINRIGFIDDFGTVATLPGEQGIIKRLVLGTTATISDTEPPIYFLDGASGVLYQSGQDTPILRPDQEAGIFVTKNVREALWREEGKGVIALDRGDPSFPVYHVYLRNGDGWLSNQLNQTEHMQPADRDLPMTTFGTCTFGIKKPSNCGSTRAVCTLTYQLLG